MSKEEERLNMEAKSVHQDLSPHTAEQQAIFEPPPEGQRKVCYGDTGPDEQPDEPWMASRTYDECALSAL